MTKSGMPKAWITVPQLIILYIHRMVLVILKMNVKRGKVHLQELVRKAMVYVVHVSRLSGFGSHLERWFEL